MELHGLCDHVDGEMNEKSPSRQSLRAAALLCAVGALLWSWSCYQPFEDLSCRDRGDCLAEQRCVEARCVAQQSCPTTPCSAGRKCEEGQCVPLVGVQCQAGQTRCGDDCVLLQTDRWHCGACDKACTVGQACQGGRCQTPGCRSRDDCPVGKRCDAQSGRCVGCQEDTDCLNGTHCDQATQTCKDNVPPGPGSPCNPDNSCPEGLGCFQVPDKAKICFELCAKDADCKDPKRPRCLAVAPNIKTCLYYAKKGEACSLLVPQQAVCEVGHEPPLYCNQKTERCDAVIMQTKEGAPCNKQGDSTPPIRRCDPKASLVCAQDTETCTKTSVAKEGERCDPTGSEGKQIPCEAGVACVGLSQDGKIKRCHRPCEPGKGSDQCPIPGTTCEAIVQGGGGVCFDRDCEKDSDCAFPDYKCRNTMSGKICLPDAP